MSSIRDGGQLTRSCGVNVIRFRLFVGVTSASDPTGRISHLGPSELPRITGFNSHQTRVHSEFKTCSRMGRTLESMMDIHSPSLAKQETSKTAESLKELMDEKIILEGTLARLNEILESHGVGIRQLRNMNLQQTCQRPSSIKAAFLERILTSLKVRNSAYLTDLVRTVRTQVIRLKNDHKDLMSRIEKGIHRIWLELSQVSMHYIRKIVIQKQNNKGNDPELLPQR
jgi:hypothetical protein